MSGSFQEKGPLQQNGGDELSQAGPYSCAMNLIFTQ